MKKGFRYICAGMMAMSLLAGCTSKEVNQTQLNEEKEETQQEETGTETVVGGWKVNESYSVCLDDDEMEIFNKAVEGLTGVGYEPIRVLATQLVSGKNYAYLCAYKNVSTAEDTGYCIVTVYNDLEGNTKILSIEKIDVAEVKTTEQKDTSEMVGTWEIKGTGKQGALSEEAEHALSKALEGFTGSGQIPIVLLGTQLVSGMNYKILCIGETVTEKPVRSVYVATVYEDLEGNCELSDLSVFDLTAYINN